jgi:hypothetical protein
MIIAKKEISRTGNTDIILTSTNNSKQIRVYYVSGKHYFQNTNQSKMHIGDYHIGLEKLQQRGW